MDRDASRMSRRLSAFVLANVIALAFGTAASAQSSSSTFKKTYDPFASLGIDKISPADPDDENQVRLGSNLYLENCAACHGGALEGAENWDEPSGDGTYLPPPHDDTGHTWHHPDKVLFEYVKLGGAELFKDYPDIESNMPGFGDVLSDEEIWAIYAFIKSSWSETYREWQAGASRLDPMPDAYFPTRSGASTSKSGE